MTETISPASAKLRGRPRQFDMDDTLDKALCVFSERGYHAASISELTEAMGLVSGSVYKAFGDKRGIFLAAFDRYRIVRRRILDDKIAEAATGRDKLLAILMVYAGSSHGIEGRRGCLVVGSATDLALFDEEAAKLVAMAFDSSEQLLIDLIGLGQRDGSVPDHIDARTTSRTLLCLLKGMRLVGKTGRNQAEMTAVAETALKLLS